LPPGCNIVVQPTISKEPYRAESRKALHIQSRSYWAPANIGPYSQAQAVLQATSKPETALWTVCVAGQIPLVPSTMALPSRPYKSHGGGVSVTEATSAFNLQVVLSLQHLWRIGKEMDVSWWSGAVAYLTRDDRPRIALKARLSGAAWEHQHQISKRKDTGEEDGFLEEERDLWEERHVGGFKNWTGGTEPKELPDWSIVDTQGNTGNFTPPFFAAEVEELPRGAQIEWHAFVGFTKCSIKASHRPLPEFE
jgi:diphthine-ammonia ligase